MCHQDAVDADVTVQSSAIEDTLPQLVEGLVSHLCEAFDFYVLPTAVIQQELATMRGRP